MQKKLRKLEHNLTVLHFYIMVHCLLHIELNSTIKSKYFDKMNAPENEIPRNACSPYFIYKLKKNIM